MRLYCGNNVPRVIHWVEQASMEQHTVFPTQSSRFSQFLVQTGGLGKKFMNIGHRISVKYINMLWYLNTFTHK